MEMNEPGFRKGGAYRGFDVLDVVELPDYSSRGIWLCHRATSLEVFHMLNADEENLFAFAFATPPADSTGAAHIIEHSVLCGSEAYPVKDAFVRLANQSVKTFLNAMTFPDKTVYPAASMSEADYFNLMAVYGDAVFFPLLAEWTFEQEGHRLELDGEGKPSIQGVVYNEMKGNYSSFDNVAADWAARSVLPGTIYDCDPGGDPKEIPALSYGRFREFHAAHYSPSNCLVFLYGNIPTERQLDFIQERFLGKFEARKDRSPGGLPARLALGRLPPPGAFPAPVVIEKPGPSSGAGTDGCTVTMTWLIGDSSDALRYMETVLLAEILMGHDGSPLMRALVGSGLGEDVAPNCGLDGEMRWVLLTAGLRGVKRQDSRRVEALVLDVLRRLCEDGVPPDDVRAAVLSVDFAQREVRRSHGPHSLVLMRRCLRGWLYGRHPCHTLSVGAAFGEVKRRINEEPGYVCGLVRRLLLENTHRSLVTVYPDESYSAGRDRLEQELAQSLLADSGAEAVRLRQEELVRVQRSPDSPEAAALIPHVLPGELPFRVDRIRTERTEADNGVPLFISREPTNGIVYVDLGFPVDVLPPEDYPYLPLFCSVATNTGFAGQDWAASSARAALNTGGFGASLFTSSMMDAGSLSEDALRSDSTLGRDWIFFKVKMLREQVSGALDLLADCVLSADFHDMRRVEDLALEFRNDMRSSVVPMGNDYAATRSACSFSRSKAVDEVWSGLTQVFFAEKMAGEVRSLPDRFAAIRRRLLEAGAVLHVTADEASMADAAGGISGLIARCGLHGPSARGSSLDFRATSRFAALSGGILPAGSSGLFGPGAAESEVFVSGAQVGFASLTCRGGGYAEAESVYEGVLAHWLTNSALWERIRTVGGAYGAFAWTDAVEQVVAFSTYRDPRPFRSLEVFEEALRAAVDKGLSEDELGRVVTGRYSREVQPRSPSGRGATGFLRSLYGFCDERHEERIRLLLGTRRSDIVSAAERVLASLREGRRTAVICGKNMAKNEENTGNIIILPV